MWIEWAWGDGSVDPYEPFPASHQYLANGIYDIQLTAHGSSGATGTEELVVDITTVNPDCQLLPTAASASIRPPLLALSPAGTDSGQLYAEVLDRFGNQLALDNHSITFFGPADTSVASVTPDGLVQVHGVPADFWSTPSAGLLVDEELEAANRSVIRSTSADLGLPYQNYEGERISYYLPESIDGIDLDAVTRGSEVVLATDSAYRTQRYLTGGVPFEGGRQFFVLDVTDDEATVPCGTSGNPIRLGWVSGKPHHQSCYINAEYATGAEPQWFVILHELGHNFTLNTPWDSFFTAYGPLSVAWVEGLASVAALWSMRAVETCQGPVGPVAMDQINRTVSESEEMFLADLAAYQDASLTFDDLNPNIVDGIFVDLLNRFGAAVWFDLFSLFDPHVDAHPCDIRGAARQATFLAAGASASVGSDLRDLFRSDYSFPIDDSLWDELLTCALGRVAARSYSLSDLCDVTQFESKVLTIYSSPEHGSVKSSPLGINCGETCSSEFRAGTGVSLRVEPSMGWQLNRWAGNTDCDDGELTMQSDKACLAVYEECATPISVVVPPQIVSEDAYFEACNFLEVEAVEVQGPAGSLTLRAGNEVILHAGFKVGIQSQLRVVLESPEEN